MVFVATGRKAAGTEQTLGVARAICNADNDEAEFAIVVHSDLKGRGLGTLLMQALTAHLHARGTRRLAAYVLKENERMLQLGAALGMRPDPAREDPDTVKLTLGLQGLEAISV
jgi:acetyltransferase